MNDEKEEIIYIPAHPIDFVKDTEFWCNHCDGNKVHSDKPSTGRFFSQFGHHWVPTDPKFRESRHINKEPGVSEEYEQVIFAICSECLG